MQRNEYLDIIKGIGILLVVLGHSIQFGMGLGNECFWDNPLFKIIYSFHMPLFMLISGWLYWYSYTNNGSNAVCIKRCKTLLYPIFIYGILVNIPILLKHPEEFSIHEAFFKAHLWFLWSIIIATCVSNLMFYLSSKYNIKEWIFIISICIIMMLFNDNWLIAEHKFVLPYFLIGAVACKYKPHVNLHYIWLVIPCYITGMLFYKSNSYIYVSKYCITEGETVWHIMMNVYRFAIGFMGTISLMLIIKHLQKDNILHHNTSKYIALLGKNTLPIYYIQGMIFAVYQRLVHQNIGWWWPFVVFVCVTALSCCFVYIIKHNKYASYTFFGQRL